MAVQCSERYVDSKLRRTFRSGTRSGCPAATAHAPDRAPSSDVLVLAPVPGSMEDSIRYNAFSRGRGGARCGKLLLQAAICF